MIWLLLLLLHLIISAAFAALTFLDILHIPTAALAVVLFVPPVGYLAALLCHLHAAGTDQADWEISLESLTVDNDVYKNVEIGTAGDEQTTVPLREALLLDDAKTKRGLMLEVLNSDTGKYAELLTLARDDKETEVSQYATTAMTELMKEFELGVQRYEQRRRTGPANAALLTAYADHLQAYLETGLLDGVLLELYRHNYLELLDALEALQGGTLAVCRRKFDALLGCADYSGAQAACDRAAADWPDQGEGYFMLLELCFALHDHAGAAAALAALQQPDVYLDHRQKQILEFWINEKANAQKN